MTKAKVAVLISGAGTNMAALLYAAKAEDCPYELVFVGSNDPDASGLKIAAAEGIATWGLSHKGMNRDAFDRFTSKTPAWYYEVVAPGFKYNMTDIAAAMGVEQLARLPEFVAEQGR